MSEVVKDNDVEVENNPEVETETELISKEEANRLIAQAKSKAKNEAKKEFDASVEERIKEAVEEAQKQAQMSSKELQKYKEQQAENEKQQLLKQIEELQLEHTRRELKDEAIKTLSERKLPVTDRVLKFVVKDTAEETLSAIDDMSEIIKEIKNEFTSSEAPMTSGGQSTQDVETDIYKILRQANQ